MLQAPEHTDRPTLGSAYCPPAAKPQARPLKPLALIRTLKRNPLECLAAPHFEQPIVAGGLPIGHVLLAPSVAFSWITPRTTARTACSTGCCRRD